MMIFCSFIDPTLVRLVMVPYWWVIMLDLIALEVNE